MQDSDLTKHGLIAALIIVAVQMWLLGKSYWLKHLEMTVGNTTISAVSRAFAFNVRLFYCILTLSTSIQFILCAHFIHIK